MLATSGGAGARSLVVFGATGRTGRRIVQLALARGHKITVLVRSRSKLGRLADRLTVIEGDALDLAAVERTIPPGTDAVLSALGRTRGAPKGLETAALGSIVQSMKKNGVKRLVVLGNSAVSDPRDSPTTGQRLLLWLTEVFRRDVYDDALTKGPVVKDSSLDWTLVRASLLTSSTRTDEYRVGPMGKGVGVRVSRDHVADFMLKCATEGTYVREMPYISD